MWKGGGDQVGGQASTGKREEEKLTDAIPQVDLARDWRQGRKE